MMVLGHSMGGRLVMESLRQLKLTGRDDVLDRLEVILAAPDIDIDVFRDQIAALGKLRHPITVLISSDDRALKVSARLAARRARLGQVDVRDPDVQKLAVEGGIRIVDITEMPGGNSTHSRYVDLISAQQDIAARNPFEGLRQAGPSSLTGSAIRSTASEPSWPTELSSSDAVFRNGRLRAIPAQRFAGPMTRTRKAVPSWPDKRTAPGHDLAS